MRNLTRSCSGLFGDDSPEAAALRAHQVFVLARGAPAMAIGNIVNSGLTVLVFLGEAPWPLLMGWLAVIWLFAALRLKSWWRNRNRPRPEQAGRRALVRSTVWSCIAGQACRTKLRVSRGRTSLQCIQRSLSITIPMIAASCITIFDCF